MWAEQTVSMTDVAGEAERSSSERTSHIVARKNESRWTETSESNEATKDLNKQMAQQASVIQIHNASENKMGAVEMMQLP